MEDGFWCSPKTSKLFSLVQRAVVEGNGSVVPVAVELKRMQFFDTVMSVHVACHRFGDFDFLDFSMVVAELDSLEQFHIDAHCCRWVMQLSYVVSFTLLAMDWVRLSSPLLSQRSILAVSTLVAVVRRWTMWYFQIELDNVNGALGPRGSRGLAIAHAARRLVSLVSTFSSFCVSGVFSKAERPQKLDVTQS